MLYIILVIVLGVTGVLIAVLDSDNDFWEKFGMGIAQGLFGAVVAFFICFITSVIVDGVADKEYVKIDENKIIALQDGSSVSGRFFLGSGSFDGTMKYVYMTSTNNEMSMDSVRVESAKLLYSDLTKIETYKSYYTNKTVRYLFGKESWDHNIYKIYIPEGTVKQNFNVDLQ
jgi:hypothetical protein